jgi:hypothetical protein
MTNVWGYRLPRTPTLKSFRTAYRAAKRKSIVNDVSYYGTIELVGSRDDLVKMLGRVLVGRFAGSKYVPPNIGLDKADGQVRIRSKSGSSYSVPRSGLPIWSDWSDRDHLETRRGTSHGENDMAPHSPLNTCGDNQFARDTTCCSCW